MGWRNGQKEKEEQIRIGREIERQHDIEYVEALCEVQVQVEIDHSYQSYTQRKKDGKADAGKRWFPRESITMDRIENNRGWSVIAHGRFVFSSIAYPR